jgi:cytochrome P450
LAFVEFRKYLVEMREETAARLKLGKPSPDESSLLVNFVMAGTPGLQTDVSLSIPTPAVLGNLFIFILAGHETSANLMANAITLLALKPDYQRAMQTEIDNIFLDQKTSQISSYTTTFTRLLDGRVGALMKEILRLYSVLPFIVKSVPGNPQTLTMEDEKRIVPTGTVIFINTSATHRSPRHWPLPREPRVPGEESPYPLSSFYPERWLPNIISASRNIDDERFDPTPGSYIPFSEGFRSCIGTRFSKIEVCAVIAHVFREYSIQLVNGDSAEALREVARNMSSGIKFEMGLKQGRSTPLRFVKRGV